MVDTSWDGPGTVADIPADTSVDDLRQMYAYVNLDGNPEAKGS